MQTYWGIDLGGTKTEGVVLSAPSPNAVVIRKRIDTEAHKGYDHILNQMVQLIDMLKAETGLTPERIGFSTPGTFDPARQAMKNCNTTVLNGKPMKQDLARLLNLPVEIANDANCLALAEATMGVVPDVVPYYQTIFGVIMGTGVGGGIVVRAKGRDKRPFVLSGPQGIVLPATVANGAVSKRSSLALPYNSITNKSVAKILPCWKLWSAISRATIWWPVKR
jgi:fructokinase